MHDRIIQVLIERIQKLEAMLRVIQPKSVARLMPNVVSSMRLYRFELGASLATGTAYAAIYQMDNTLVESTNVLDPEGIFAVLGDGDRGLCLKQDGNYYVIQASCPA